jgi:hypothetical protein
MAPREAGSFCPRIALVARVGFALMESDDCLSSPAIAVIHECGERPRPCILRKRARAGSTMAAPLTKELFNACAHFRGRR